MDQRLHDAIQRVKGDGKSRNIPCPAHHGRKQSLRIFRGQDGGIGLRCYSKECSTAAILDATGLSRSILRPDGARRERLLRVEHDIGATYDYTDDSGALLFQVVRQQPKGFFQRRPGPDGGWLANLKGIPTPRPPYRLVDLSKPERAEETVFVVEGEKDADLLARLDLLATTNAGGAGKASSTDWSVLAGRKIVILPDNDDKGAAHARDLVRVLSPVAKDVRVVRLPDLPPKGDVSDWAKMNRNGTDLSSLAARLIEIANDASPTLAPTNMGTAPTDECAPVEDAPKPWRPFPVDSMPEPFCSFIRQSAIARQCDPAAVALPLLAAIGGTIGNTTRLRLWPDWIVPPVLWAAIISPSGSVKSPAFRAALAPLDAVEREDRVGFDSAQAEYERACMTYDAELADWRRKHDREEPPEKPAPPVLVRRIIDDTTIQALGHVLAENPRGVLLARDELSGWVRSFDQFHAASGADVARWLEFYNAGSIRVDRVGKGHLHIPRAAVSICGTIQDEVLLNAFTSEHRSNGLLARFILARPPEMRRRWRSSESAHDEADAVQRRFELLADLPIPEPRAEPRVIRLSADAEALYESWFNAHNADKAGETEALRRATLSKVEELPGRLALVLGLASSSNPAAISEIEADIMRRAIGLADWFRDESTRVLGFFGESAEQRTMREVVDWVGRQDGPVTLRDAMRGPRSCRDRGAGKKILAAAVASGLLVAEVESTGPKGGRPTTRFCTPDYCTSRGDGDRTSRATEVVSPSPLGADSPETSPPTAGNEISSGSRTRSSDL